jgi:hypothetical protein
VGTRLFKQFIGEGFFSLRNGDATSAMAREHGKWFKQRKSLVRVFTAYNISIMGETVANKSHELIDILAEHHRATSNQSVAPAVDIQELFFQVRCIINKNQEILWKFEKYFEYGG